MRRSSLLVAVAMLVMLVGFAPPAVAHSSPGYSHDSSVGGTNSDWMASLPDSARISELSIPGTHDSMAFYGGDAAQTQSMSLPTQLSSGVRVLDIRVRHMNNGFALYHGPISQNADFGRDVMTPVNTFLEQHPDETVLMRVKEESTQTNNTETFKQTFDRYMSEYGGRVWPTADGNPTLGEIRGKVVILDDFAGGARGIPWDDADIQDQYQWTTNWDLGYKWMDVKAQLDAANSGSSSTRYVNFLSAAWPAMFPYFAASGHSSPQTGAPRLLTGWTDGFINTCKNSRRCIKEFPRVNCFLRTCSVAFEGTNILTMNYLNQGSVTRRAGIIMADFPGAGLLGSIIHVNPIPPHFSTPVPSAGAGNPDGGSPATALCSSEALLTGLTLHMNGSAGSVTGFCSPLRYTGSALSLGPPSALPTIGHTGTRDTTATCPSGSVVTGFGGRSGLLVDGVQLYCSHLNTDGSLGSESTTAYIGGTGGSAFPKKTCPGGLAIGLFGRSGNDLDYLALECSTLSR